MTTKVLVWDLPTRLFHWTLAGAFAGAWVTAESERWRDVHATLGYTMLALVAFRLLWGIVGTRYARFASFSFGPRAVREYLRSLLHGRPQHFVGHNPAGSWAIWALLAMVLSVSASGVSTLLAGGEWSEDLHEALATAMLVLVGVHVAGVVVGSLLHRENLVGSMVDGRKRAEPAAGIRHRRPLVAAGVAALVLTLWAGAVPLPGTGGGAYVDGDARSSRAAPREDRGRGREAERPRNESHRAGGGVAADDDGVQPGSSVYYRRGRGG